MSDKALIVVDVQNDFMPDGALPAPGGYDIVPLINQLIDAFDHVIATQDWHPRNHGSFASNHSGREPGEIIELNGLEQILWPDHCIQKTEGAAFVDNLETDQFEQIFKKGIDPEIDSYSGFFDNGHQRSTGLDGYLTDQGIESLYIAGIATDVCVKFTVLDACELGYETHLVIDACRGVAQSPGDIEKSVAAMSAEGASIVASNRLL